jgi:aryl-alcohol dehydrogenase-like predicted oxidoreductase
VIVLEYRRIGKSGLKATVFTYGTALTIGTESKDLDYAQKMIDKAWEVGIRSFDTSNNYGNGNAEILTGKALKRYPRNLYIISTKGSWPIGESPYERGLSRKHIMEAFDASMKRLELDYVDIYYAHRYDEEVPMEEIVRTFNNLINSGRIRYWGTSEWTKEALEECIYLCNKLGMEAPIVEQPIYSFAIRKVETNGVKAFCEESGIGIMCFSPLAQGLLTGKYRGGKIPEDSRISKSNLLGYDKTLNIYNQNRERIDSFIDIADKYSIEPALLGLKWLIDKGVLPIIGASKPEQLEFNSKALKVKISEELLQELNSIV